MNRDKSDNLLAFEVERIVATNRVAKVVKGGRNFSFNAIVVVGDKKGNVGVGTGKANEIVGAIRKAKEKAAKSIFRVPIVKGTIPHEIIGKFGASRILLKPASPGTGIIAGGPARAILEAVGIENILSKSLGSNTKGNVVKATIDGLKNLMTISQAAAFRGKSTYDLIGHIPQKKVNAEQELNSTLIESSTTKQEKIQTESKHINQIPTEVTDEKD